MKKIHQTSPPSKKNQPSIIHAESTLVYQALRDQLIFRPALPGDNLPDNTQGIRLTQHRIEVDAANEEFNLIKEALQKGTFSLAELKEIIKTTTISPAACQHLIDLTKKQSSEEDSDSLQSLHQLDYLANLAVKIINRTHELLLTIEPLTEIHFHFTDSAKAVLAIGWHALVKRGIYSLSPRGTHHLQTLHKHPLGAMHFVSASDLDGGYHYTIGIALSPEAQSLGTLDVSYGLDGELIVPGQAVSPIPPFLAIGTRLFAAGIATSSNISEEVQSIPMRNYPHPTASNDLSPSRRGIYEPAARFDTIDQLMSDVQQQLWRNSRKSAEVSTQTNDRFIHQSPANIAITLPPVKAVIEVTDMTPNKICQTLNEIFAKDKNIMERRKEIALYLNIESTTKDRIARVNEIVDAASALDMKYVAIADNEDDQWLPNLLEYLAPDELNAIADHSDQKGIIVIDGRPVDPIYTAATSAQRIQSVYTTLAVDILKMGMWLCLDALTARIVYRELLNHPHIPAHMLLMPIGIVEPWNAFVDNRNINKTPRAILDPFEKIKFMIEEAKELGIPSLLTDTRHKEVWVLLGNKTGDEEAHVREEYVRDPLTHTIICRTPQSAIPLLSWNEFMQCERLARDAGIMLGQAGSIETSQLFRILSETTYDAAKEGKNPATAIWTAETERVLSTECKRTSSELQSQRSAIVSPFLAVINRGFESHAKLDGWLHYLADQQDEKSASLRQLLQKQRTNLYQLLQAVLDAQTAWRNKPEPKSKVRYQEAWDQFRLAYLDYHHRIKNNFSSVRMQVEKKWAAQAKPTRAVELEEG